MWVGSSIESRALQFCYARCQAIESQVIQSAVYQKLVKQKVREAAAPGKLVARSATGTTSILICWRSDLRARTSGTTSRHRPAPT